MKKIITLLLSIAACTTSFAQYNYGQNSNRNYRPENKWDNQYANSSSANRAFGRDDRNRGRFSRENIFSVRERDFQIKKINLDFIFRVHEIQNDSHRWRHEKKAAIRDAEMERSKQIDLVNDRFNCYR